MLEQIHLDIPPEKIKEVSETIINACTNLRQVISVDFKKLQPETLYWSWNLSDQGISVPAGSIDLLQKQGYFEGEPITIPLHDKTLEEVAELRGVTLPEITNDYVFVPEQHDCVCNIVDIMRYGCRCGGK